jgi:hypothetical protein
MKKLYHLTSVYVADHRWMMRSQEVRDAQTWQERNMETPNQPLVLLVEPLWDYIYYRTIDLPTRHCYAMLEQKVYENECAYICGEERIKLCLERLYTSWMTLSYILGVLWRDAICLKISLTRGQGISLLPWGLGIWILWPSWLRENSWFPHEYGHWSNHNALISLMSSLRVYGFMIDIVITIQ